MPIEDRVGASVEEAVHDIRELLNGLVGMDPLTGLGNSRAFRTRLETDLGGVPLGLVTAEVNGFKGINDDRGHQQGDLILVEVAARIGDAVRGHPQAQAFRLGGDEFAIVLEEDDHAPVTAVGESVRACVAAQPFALAGGGETHPREVTVAVAVGCVGRDGAPEQRLRLRDELDALTEYQKYLGLTDQVARLWEMSGDPDYAAFLESGQHTRRRRFLCPQCKSRGYASLTLTAGECPRCSPYFERQRT